MIANSCALATATFLIAVPAVANSGKSLPAKPGLIGVSWPAWHPADYDKPREQATRFAGAGFDLVALVPTYTYRGLNDIDFSTAPSFESLTHAMSAVFAEGLGVVLKPHLDPQMYQPGFDPLSTDSMSWRTNCPWRGYFDVDPMSDGYRAKVLERSVLAIKSALKRHPNAKLPVRLDLGAELMNSIVYAPQRWVELQTVMRKFLKNQGLTGKVVLSHNFNHHIQYPEDFVLRMPPAARLALAQYIKGLDAIGLSQYADLTITSPKSNRAKRLTTAAEVAQALREHERNFRQVILQKLLGLKPSEIPALHIGEFGIGRGGLKHPNYYEGQGTAVEEANWKLQVAAGHAGLATYLAGASGRNARSAILWVTGPRYDIFGWKDAAARNAEAVKAYQ